MFSLTFCGFPWFLELLEVVLELLELVLSLSLSYLNVFLVSAVGVGSGDLFGSVLGVF